MKYYYVFGGAIGDALLGIHLARVLALNAPNAQLVLVAMRENTFAKELVGTVSSASYIELSKTRWTDWFKLPQFLASVSNSVVYEPTTGPVPLWWALPLFLMRLRGGTQIRYHMRTHEHSVPATTTSLTYTCSSENLFDTVYPILDAWKLPSTKRVTPSLSYDVSDTGTKNHTMLFHFFAGQYRRSFPVEKSNNVLQLARKKFPEHRFVVSCVANELPRAERMVEGVTNVTIKIDVAVSELLTLIKESDIVVGVASGVTHISSQLGQPSVVLCNLSDPCWLPTYAKTSRLLYDKTHCSCSGEKSGECSEMTPEGSVYRCLYNIKPESVVETMEEFLKSPL
jgi:ADP-heptose:LPS heptosyltransferase